ncbi:hypothetical protein HALLA_00265 (plasmid) [Halostagnicola larsenii XH-48]|uniref:Uncharacterized protein n=1 Tax=Halostagnicola larsenii XH-48 TaxID=797299 RepID=W0JWT1_9EURY|nr:hypothetical protein [Halostagnicola larsenii]AHG01757.1 hypothetical protein HALLA_00265 [Halostagnicola larsenii XH-48]
MVERIPASTNVSSRGVALVLSAAVFGVAFLAWRRTAPLSRWFLQRRRERAEHDRHRSDSQRPGTVPI